MQSFIKLGRRGLAGIMAVGVVSALPADDATNPPITLQECIVEALLHNRALQIERLNPEIARSRLDASYGYYDPIFMADARRESLADSGGLDPADFSRDAVYSADSHTVRMGLTGFLPSGMSYSFAGSYAASSGDLGLEEFEAYSAQAGVFVRQPLLKNFWIDQGRMTIKVNKNNLKITELGVAYLTMDTVNQVQQAYYEFLFAWEDLKVQLRLVEARQQFLTGVRRQMDEGMMALPDEQLAQSALAAAEAFLASSSNTLALAENALKTLMADPFDPKSTRGMVPSEQLVVVPENFDRAESGQHGLAYRPDLLQLRQDLERADIDLKYRRNQLFPSLDAIAGYGRRGASTWKQSYPAWFPDASPSDVFRQMGAGDNPNDMVGVIFSLPLSRKMERGNYQTSRHLKAQAELLLKQKEELVLREIADAIDTAHSSLDRVRATRRAAQYSKAALAAEEQRLAGGKSTLFFVLQLQRDLAAAQSAKVRAEANYNQAVSQLRFADASILEDHRIELDFRGR